MKEIQTYNSPDKHSEIDDASIEINICSPNGANLNSTCQSNEDGKRVISDCEHDVNLKDCKAEDNKNGTCDVAKEVEKDITSPSLESQSLEVSEDVKNIVGENKPCASPESTASFEVKEKQLTNGLHETTPDSTIYNPSNYFNTLQFLSENGTQKNFAAWKSWLSSLESPYQTNNFALAQNSSLVNDYLKQFTDYWNSILHHDLKSSSFYLNSLVNQEDLKSNLSDSTIYSKDLDTGSCLEQRSPSNTVDEKTIIRNPSTSSSFASSSGISSERQDLGNNCSPVFPENSGLKKSNENGERKSNRHKEYDSFNQSKQAQSQSNDSSTENPVSKSHKCYDSNESSYGTWSNPAWSYYSSPHYSDYSPHSLYSLPSRGSREVLRKSSSSSDKSASVEEKLSPFNQCTPAMYNGDQYSYQSPRQKHSDCNSYQKKSEATSTAMEAFQRQCNLPYMPLYNSLWYGSQLPFNPSLPYPYGSILNAFSPDIASLGALAGSNGMSSLKESTGYLSSLPYKRDGSMSFSPSMEKMLSSRRTRARGFAFDNFHAEIVKKAKEQSKGVDPENMYIQCPICQKRIKRLYHFQRHMRIHTGEKTHQCPNCQYKSVRKDNLKSHMKTHEKQNLEIGRKGGKASFRINSNSDMASEISQSRTLESSADSNCANEKKFNDMTQDNGLDLTARNKDASKTKNSISPPEINEFRQYSNLINNTYAMPESAWAQMARKNLTGASPCHLNGNAINVKVEDELQKHRSKYDSLTGMFDVYGRPNYEVTSDVLKKHGDFLKRGMEVGQDKLSNKRLKVVDSAQDSGASSSKVINNLNNNNDSDDHYSMETQFSLPISNRDVKHESDSKIDVSLPNPVPGKEFSPSNFNNDAAVEMSNQSSNSR